MRADHRWDRVTTPIPRPKSEGKIQEKIDAELDATVASADGVVSPDTRARGPAAAALLREEIDRTRGWAVCVSLLAVAALAFAGFLDLQPAIAAVFVASLLGFIGISSWVLWTVRHEHGYTARVFRVYGWGCATLSFGLVYSVGPFSPVPLVLTLGIWFFGLGLDRRHAILVPLHAISGYTAISLLITTGLIDDRGLLDSSSHRLIVRVFFCMMVPFVLGVTLWMARLSRSTMQDAVRRSSQAQLLAAQREAQLAEAQRDLEHVLKAGAGMSGRFTGRAAGDYVLAELVGRGAMGEVYAATDPISGGRYAVKVLRAEAREDAGKVARFLREGEAAGSLAVPNVARVHATGRMDDGTPFLAMELLEGEDLAARLRRRGRLDTSEALTLLAQVARGLDAAHASDIVHRDLKPQNIFHHRAPGDGLGIWKILDFGVCKLQGSAGTLTQAGIVGTPGYMAPEQARGEPADHRCDLFSLGAVMYRVLTGRPPFAGADTPQTLYQLVYEMPAQPTLLSSRLPAAIDSVLAIALAKRPGNRFASAGDMARAFASALEGELDEGLRARAEALLAAHPWGTTMSDQRRDR